MLIFLCQTSVFHANFHAKMSCQPFNLNPSAEKHAADEVMPSMMPPTGVPMDPYTQSLQTGNSKLNPDARPFFALSACATNFCPQKWHHATPAHTWSPPRVRRPTVAYESGVLPCPTAWPSHPHPTPLGRPCQQYHR